VPDATSTTAPNFPLGSVEHRWSGEGTHTVVVLGDSITVLARDSLREALGARYRTKIAALTGEGFGGGPLTSSLDAGEPLLQQAAAEYGADSPDVVVLALGTNDAWQPSLVLDDALDGMTFIVSQFPASCIVAVEIAASSDADGYDEVEAGALNDALAGIGDEVVPALTAAETRPDRIHPNDRGVYGFVERVASAVDRCVS